MDFDGLHSNNCKVLKAILNIISCCLSNMYISIESRQRGRFAGFSLYVSNTTNKDSGVLCYKDGPVLPPLDFFTNCLLQGRYVIFYNERLDKITYPSGYQASNVYTELCEVIVTGNILCISAYLHMHIYFEIDSLTVPNMYQAIFSLRLFQTRCIWG